LVQQVRWGHRECKEFKGFKEQQVHKECKAHKGFKGYKVRREQQEIRGQPERREKELPVQQE